MKQKTEIFLVYFFSLIGIIAWIAAIFLAPYLRSKSLSSNIFIYTLFSPVCHQIPSRSFFLFGYQLAVCARCLGIYFGFMAGMIIYPFLRGFSTLSLPKTRTFFIMILPIGIDTIGNFFRIWATSNWPRFSLGFIWGTILPFYFIYGFAELLISKSPLKLKK